MIRRTVALPILAHLLATVTTAFIAVLLISGLQANESLLLAVPFIVLLTVTLVVGWVLAVRLPRQPVGWILMAIPALFTLNAPLTVLGTAMQTSAPGVTHWIAWYTGSWSWLPPVWLLLIRLPLRFPDGRLPSPRWRWFSRLTVVALITAGVYLGAGEPELEPGVPNVGYVAALHTPLLPSACLILLAASFIGAIASLFVRYSHAPAQVRAQLRWMLWAVAVAVAGLIVGFVVPTDLEWLQDWVLLLYGLVPVAVAIAVLRYRLYEIDRIISRTAAYAIVTLVVVGTYAAVVLVVGLLPALQPVGVALPTLAAAAVFLPVLRLVRHGIDRVFDRAQYDAERVVDSFGERVRNGADPHTAGRDLTVAIQQTLQPSTIGLWVRR